MIYLLAMLLLPVVVGFGPSPPLQPAGTLVHKLKVAGWTDASPTLSPDVRNLFSFTHRGVVQFLCLCVHHA